MPIYKVKAGTKAFANGSANINGRSIRTKQRRGAGETFSVWCWELPKDIVIARDASHPYPNGTPQYASLSWNNYTDRYLSGLPANSYNDLKDSPAKWGKRQLGRNRAAGLSDALIAFCDAGQYDNYCGGSNPDNGIYNYNSHKKSKYGGTDVVFGDTHVGWVDGSRVGWP